MSCSWSYWCEDCQVEMDGGMNHGDQQLTALYQAWMDGLNIGYEALERFDVWIVEVQSVAYGMGNSIEFLRAHDTHDIRVISEYGEKNKLEMA